MTTIWKFPFTKSEVQAIEMPVGAKVLCIQEQRGSLQLWALVNPKAETETRRLLTYGTGHAIEADNLIYLTTYQISGGYLVLHVFESKEVQQ